MKKTITIPSLLLILLTSFTSCMPTEKENLERRYYQKGRDAFFRKDFESALPYFHAILRSKVVAKRMVQLAHFHLGLSYFHLGEDKKAREHFAAYQKTGTNVLDKIFLNQGEKLNNTIISIYRDLLEKNSQGAQEKLLKTLQTNKTLSGIHLSAINFAISQLRLCDLYIELDKIYRSILEKMNTSLAKEESRQPQLLFSGLECLLIHHKEKLKIKSGGQTQAQKFLDLLAKQPLSVNHYAPLADAYRAFLQNKMDLAEKKGLESWQKSHSQESFSFLVRIYQLQSKYNKIIEFINANISQFSKSHIDQYNLASYLAIANDKKMALIALDNALRFGFRDLAHIRLDPDMDSLRNEPDFKNLIKNYFPESFEKNQQTGK